jgi:hypothetical protein
VRRDTLVSKIDGLAGIKTISLFARTLSIVDNVKSQGKDISMNKPVREGFVENEPIQVQVEEAQQEAAPALEAETWPVTVRLLHKPIRNNKGELVNELNFREPTAGDISRAGGNPCRFDSDYNPIIDDRKMMTIMANLSGVMEPFLQGMDPRDYNSCAYRLRNFFLPEVAAWTPTPTT